MIILKKLFKVFSPVQYEDSEDSEVEKIVDNNSKLLDNIVSRMIGSNFDTEEDIKKTQD